MIASPAVLQSDWVGILLFAALVILAMAIGSYGIKMRDDGPFPLPPEFTKAQMDACRESGDFRPILFEWYKYTGMISTSVVRIDLSSPAAKPVPNLHYGILVGLLNRCNRLMLSNIALSHKGLFGETTAIIDRCIFESCVKLRWLCSRASEESFSRYIADGLKTELALKREIDTRIFLRAGVVLPIEQRMLESIDKTLRTSGMTDGEITSAKKLPDLATMLVDLDQDKLVYVVGQKVGSHHVHGTWPSLLFHYLEQADNGNFSPRDHNVQTHVNQYFVIPLMVLGAAKAFSTWLMDVPEASELTNLLDSIEDELLAMNQEVVGDDFTPPDEA